MRGLLVFAACVVCTVVLGIERVRPGPPPAPWPCQQRSIEGDVLTNNNQDSARVEGALYVQALGLRAGDTVADVGCGSGAQSLYMAGVVGDGGHVWAVDINPEAVAYVQARARVMGLRNLITVPSRPTDVCLARGSVRCILLCNVLHCFLNPHNQDDEDTYRRVTRPFLRSMWNALQPRGRLLVVDCGPLHSFGNSVAGRCVRRDFQRSGFRLLRAWGNDDENYRFLMERSASI